MRATFDEKYEKLGNGQLMERFYQGDVEAFGVLAERIRPSLMGQALGRLPGQLVGRQQLAEDLVQETLYKAALTRNRPQVRWQSSRGAISTWLGTILKNQLTSHLRSRQSRTQVSSDLWAGQVDEDRNAVEQRLVDHRLPAERKRRDDEARQQQWLEIVGKLPKELSSMVQLQLQGKSHREIAARLGLARSTVTYRIKNAAATLRSMAAA